MSDRCAADALPTGLHRLVDRRAELPVEHPRQATRTPFRGAHLAGSCDEQFDARRSRRHVPFPRPPAPRGGAMPPRAPRSRRHWASSTATSRPPPRLLGAAPTPPRSPTRSLRDRADDWDEALLDALRRSRHRSRDRPAAHHRRRTGARRRVAEPAGGVRPAPDQRSGLSSTICSTTVPSIASTRTSPRRCGGSSVE